jgi:hypothetical protein
MVPEIPFDGLKIAMDWKDGSRKNVNQIKCSKVFLGFWINRSENKSE